MLRIINQQGLVLELNSDDLISVEKNNPLFNDADKLFQDISYPGKAGFTDNNKVFFNLAHLVESPNSYYTFPVQVEADGDIFLTGNIKFRIAPNAFEFNLEPNLTAVTYLMKNIRMTEIRAEDGNYNVGTVADMEALMLDTCVNPDKYPFIFMPVYNDNYCQQVTHYYSINNYDVEPNYHRFRANADNNDYGWGQSAYWKVIYMLGVVANYLGFTLEGSIITDDYYKKLYIYTRRAPADPLYYPSFAYMPNMPIAAFIKDLRERLHLIFDFNLTTKVLTVESFKTISDLPPVDLSAYIGSTIEQQLPPQQGLTISLKADEQDASYLVQVGDNKNYPPLFKLVLGDGSNVIELNCGTLKTATTEIPGVTLPKTSQNVVAIHSWGATGIPPDLSYTDQYDPTTLNNWPLRLIRFLGYKPGADGYNFPFGEGVELDQHDIDYYQFINDGKQLIITAYFPPAVLAGLKSTGKYTFRTEGYNYCDIIIEKITYDIGTNTDLVPTKIYARTLNPEKTSQVAIIPVTEATPPPADSLYTIPAMFKACFNPVLHGVTQVDVEIIPDANPVDNFAGFPVRSQTKGSYTIDPIKISTNSQYAGGSGIPAVYVWGTITIITGQPVHPTTTLRDPTITTATLTVLKGNPRYILHRGLKLPFTTGSDGRATMRIDFADYFAFMADFYIIIF